MTSVLNRVLTSAGIFLFGAGFFYYYTFNVPRKVTASDLEQCRKSGMDLYDRKLREEDFSPFLGDEPVFHFDKNKGCFAMFSRCYGSYCAGREFYLYNVYSNQRILLYGSSVDAGTGKVREYSSDAEITNYDQFLEAANKYMGGKANGSF